jgi:hypothetical protein
MIALFIAPTLADAGKKKDSGKANPSASASPTPRFDLPIPPGHDAHGVTIPYFDAQGRLEMFFSIKMAFREDLDHLRMEKAFMQTYDDKGMADANVFMSRSVLDLNTRIVTSDVPSFVRRSDFEIVGQKMIFNTQTHVGRMWGHVRMTIYNHQEVSAPSPTPATSPAASPSVIPPPTHS